MKLEEYLNQKGHSPFGDWFDNLEAMAAAKVTIVLTRIERGNLSNVKPVGSGVSEYKIDFGPGYRIYFGMDGLELIILLGGGTKRRQGQDIEDAKALWTEYKARKKGKM